MKEGFDDLQGRDLGGSGVDGEDGDANGEEKEGDDEGCFFTRLVLIGLDGVGIGGGLRGGGGEDVFHGWECS